MGFLHRVIPMHGSARSDVKKYEPEEFGTGNATQRATLRRPRYDSFFGGAPWVLEAL
jgi:hypothetical protein